MNIVQCNTKVCGVPSVFGNDARLYIKGFVAYGSKLYLVDL